MSARDPSVSVGDLLRPGAIIRTNYGTGPYVVEHVSGPCRCPEYLDCLDHGGHWNVGLPGGPKPSEKHFHLTVRPSDPGHLVNRRRKTMWLNGYRPDGTSVWCEDRIELVP